MVLHKVGVQITAEYPLQVGAATMRSAISAGRLKAGSRAKVATGWA